MKLARLATVGALALTAPAAWSSQDVHVIVDMDAAAPGIQSSVFVPANRGVVEGIAVHVFDPKGGRALWGIGYVGGLDRGIAFGHVPNPQNHGVVTSMTPAGGIPINPDNTQELLSPAHHPGFPGPEVQYLEWGAERAAAIRRSPDAAVFTVDVSLDGARPGDVFDFHLLDMVTVWSGGGHGAFSTTAPINSLDTGGDAVPDGTRSAYGTDPDSGVAVPPGAYRVDYIDGGNGPGPATIVVTPVLSVEPDRSRTRTFTLRSPEPNPVTEATVIRFDLAVSVAVQLGVYDLTGRRVRALVHPDSRRESGPHIVVWDGRDDSGRAAPAGVYYVKLEADGGFAMRSLVRLR